MILRRLINSVRLARAISMMRQDRLDQSDQLLAKLRFEGFYNSLALTLRAFIAFLKMENGSAIRFLEASSAGCAQLSHKDAKYISLYNDYLSAAIADDTARVVENWHELQTAPSTKLVRDALVVVERLPDLRRIKRKPIIH